jgi:hypothetical protein
MKYPTLVLILCTLFLSATANLVTAGKAKPQIKVHIDFDSIEPDSNTLDNTGVTAFGEELIDRGGTESSKGNNMALFVAAKFDSSGWGIGAIADVPSGTKLDPADMLSVQIKSKNRCKTNMVQFVAIDADGTSKVSPKNLMFKPSPKYTLYSHAYDKMVPGDKGKKAGFDEDNIASIGVLFLDPKTKQPQEAVFFIDNLIVVGFPPPK